MMNKHSIYTEAVYYEQENGTCKWLGRVYNRVGPSRVLETQDGIAPSRKAAVEAVKGWSEAVLALNTIDDKEHVVITAADVGVLDVANLNLE